MRMIIDIEWLRRKVTDPLLLNAVVMDAFINAFLTTPTIINGGPERYYVTRALSAGTNPYNLYTDQLATQLIQSISRERKTVFKHCEPMVWYHRNYLMIELGTLPHLSHSSRIPVRENLII